MGDIPKTALQKRIDNFIRAAQVVQQKMADPSPDIRMVSQLKRATKREAGKLYAKGPDSVNYLLLSRFSGVNCLNNACKRGQLYLAELLVKEMKIDPNKVADTIGKNALHYCTECDGNQEFFESLITEFDANINAQDVYGTSVLHLAVYNDKPNQVNFLLERGATVDNGNFFGFPMHIAAFYGRVGMVDAIRQKNHLEVNRVYQGYSPVECSVYAETSECFMHLSTICELNVSVLYKIISSKRSDQEALPMVNHLLGLNVNANDYNENLHEELPIMAAAGKGWGGTVAALLERTSPVLGPANWTVPDLLVYGQTEEYKSRTENRIQLIKSDIIQELTNRQLLAGSCLCKSIQHYVEHPEWDKYDSFCKLMLNMGMYTSCFADVDVASFMMRGRMYVNVGKLDLAQLVAKSLQLLDPHNQLSQLFYDELERVTSAASTSSRT
ncbi:unnamed protein product [Alopecurus aequalis]